MRMEDIVRYPSNTVGAYLASCVPEGKFPDEKAHSYSSITGRSPGTIDPSSHYRSGKVDQWREALPESIIKCMRAHYGEILGAYYPKSLV